MFIVYTILAVIISAIIDWIRITLSIGKVSNINKVVTFTIGATLFGICLALIYTDYYYTPGFFEILTYSIFYTSSRATLYDVILNLLRDKEIDYISTSTNSLIDFIERTGLKWGFWTERLVYLIGAIVSGMVYQNLY